MKIQAKVLIVLTGLFTGCFCFHPAAEAAKIPRPGFYRMSPEVAAKCPQCADALAKVNAKQDEIGAVQDKLKAWQAQKRAERKASPKAQATEPAALAVPQAGKPMSKEERLAFMKQKDPQTFDLVEQKRRLNEELQALVRSLRECEQTCR